MHPFRRQANAADKQEIWAAELGEMCNMIAYQLDRAMSVEQAGQKNEPLLPSTSAAPPLVPRAAKRPLPPATSRAMASAAADGVTIGDAGAKGLGAFAARAFDKDVTVGDYEGEWLSTR
jgi:hypothetical protein